MNGFERDTPWPVLREAGLTVTEAARVRGVNVQAASKAFKRLGGALQRGHAAAWTPERRARQAALAQQQSLGAAAEARGLRAVLTPAERADYDLLVTKGGYRRDEALRAIGRADLVPPARQGAGA